MMIMTLHPRCCTLPITGETVVRRIELLEHQAVAHVQGAAYVVMADEQSGQRNLATVAQASRHFTCDREIRPAPLMMSSLYFVYWHIFATAADPQPDQDGIPAWLYE